MASNPPPSAPEAGEIEKPSALDWLVYLVHEIQACSPEKLNAARAELASLRERCAELEGRAERAERLVHRVRVLIASEAELETLSTGATSLPSEVIAAENLRLNLEMADQRLIWAKMLQASKENPQMPLMRIHGPDSDDDEGGDWLIVGDHWNVRMPDSEGLPVLTNELRRALLAPVPAARKALGGSDA